MGKPIAEDQDKIDLRIVRKDGGLAPGSFGKTGEIWFGIGGDAITLSYWNGTRGLGQTVAIKRIPCHLGGSRVSFVCPICARQVMVLYVGENDFRCKACAGVQYLTQTKHRPARLLLKAERIRSKLQASEDDPTCKRVARPLRMKHETFERLKKEAVRNYRQGQRLLAR
ncbi:MAG: hypothetical protein J0665_19835 [Deltaproteobacteria bacterium]|nr:hypothetical protein [Deltaproteobacteria bacterium]